MYIARRSFYFPWPATARAAPGTNIRNPKVGHRDSSAGDQAHPDQPPFSPQAPLVVILLPRPPRSPYYSLLSTAETNMRRGSAMGLRSPFELLFLLFTLLVPLTSAVRFDLIPNTHSGKHERCIRNFVARDQLVVVTATVSGSKGDGQVVNMHIKSSLGDDYAKPKDIAGEIRQMFTASADSSFDVCFSNVLSGRHAGPNPSRQVELSIDIGADARDWDAIKVQEKLKPVEADLRRLEAMITEIVAEMDFMRAREQKLRDTNESTNERVKWFAFGTMGMLIGLGVWQVVYLRAYFR
ncbi:hypothetical protein TRV_02935 [Trichophyton verrucosum HKI 0517]|uniref:GOLD domain-containing protein n=1 Tax=Trichophyton verrucosum (strain HKI 0517) TaxID=663202 RepID=D4D756_TRIVH|nr:uncharacterized protein TRV_02935 [Trichophyton verrucosum HKI 0517]EFE42330.1 hypothetical protein TRV_02935 [Trichophyton verrucosum HKI 0517]